MPLITAQFSTSIFRILIHKCIYQLGCYTILYYGYKGICQVYQHCSIRSLRFLFFQLLLQFSFIRKKIKERQSRLIYSIRNDLNQPIKTHQLTLYTHLGQTSESVDYLHQQIKHSLSLGNYNWNQGKVSGAVYAKASFLQSLVTSIVPYYYLSNPLHPDIYPGLRKMEAELIQMTAHLFHSPDPCAGSFTTGGTESILLACRAYRELAKQRGIQSPSIIVCNSAHAAYWKAADYLGIELIEVEYELEIDQFGQLTAEIVESHIQPNTIAVISSAPSFHFGLLDPIESLGKLCLQKNLFLHIDMCLGGFLLPFLEGYESYSFQTTGVTSISVDTHKYGCGPKGGSVILYREKEIFQAQMFVKEDWTGGIYGTSNMTGSRSGNTVSLTWATMRHLGIEGYQQQAQKIQRFVRQCKKGIDSIPGIFYCGEPDICIVAIASKLFDIYLLSDRLKQKGWNLNVLQQPACFHICFTNCHTSESVEEFISVCRKQTALLRQEVLQNPNTPPQSSSIYGTTQKIETMAPGLVGQVIKDYCYVLNDLSINSPKEYK